ncbi:hypothetical protein Mgra_00007499 [Meloidogyne graminicola]|uniref:Uncharacterized protein n=1 Tax=Meloidogyne graminicola TaxID=189291 RepID=A0A8S9ZIK7_9BILA|nr:hypothetical protein Mgra_00007499 [Meloidogyne graminicola]
MDRHMELEEMSRKFNGRINKLNAQMNSIEENIYFERMANTIIPNKWQLTSCCENNCVFHEDYSGLCISGKDYVKVATSPGVNSIDYYYSEDEKKSNQKGVVIHAVHSFSVMQLHQYNYSFYFEATFFKLGTKIKQLPNEVGIGFTNKQGLEVALWIDKETKFTSYTINSKFEGTNSKFEGTIKLKKVGDFCEDDIFGAGIRPLEDGRAYVYFTKNATNIGKYVLLRKIKINLFPYVSLRSCSVKETKFQATVLPLDDPPDSDFYNKADWK